MIRYAESFAIYGTGGTGNGNMLRGNPWADAASSGPSTAQPHGLQTHSYLGTAAVSSGTPLLRLLMLTTETEFGVGAFVRTNEQPSTDNELVLFQARDVANAPQCSLMIGAGGALVLKRGAFNGAEIARSVDGVIPTNAYTHVEAKFLISNTVGGVVVRVNGEEVLNVTNLDTQDTGNAGAAQMSFIRVSSGATCNAHMSDLFWWDTSNADGAGNDDFIGQVQWIAKYPNADTAVSDWTRNTGSDDYAMIDDTVQDGDTTYIAATVAGEVSEFGFEDLPTNVSEVVAVFVRSLVRKTDPGSSNFQQGVVSGADSEDGASYPLTEVYSYYTDAFSTDPATGIRWNPAGVDSLLGRYNKAV